MGEVDAFLDDVEESLRDVPDRDALRKSIYAELHDDFQITLEGRASELAETKVEEARTAFAQEREHLTSEVAGLETTQHHLTQEIEQLRGERDALREQLEAAGQEIAHREIVEVAVPTDSDTLLEKLDEAPAPADVDTSEPEPTLFRVETVAEASAAARRLLEIATASHDEMLAAAQAEAAALIAEGETKLAEAEATAETRSAELTEQYEADKARFETSLDELREQEKELRTRLRSFLTDHLELLGDDEE